MRGHHTRKEIVNSRVDWTMTIIASVAPLTALPQIITIWTQKSAKDISLATTIGYCVLTLFWLLYGIHRKENPVIISSILWLVFDVVILIGVLMF